MHDDGTETPAVETAGRENEGAKEEAVPGTEPREDQEGGRDDDSLPSMTSLGQVAFRWEDCVDLTSDDCCRVDEDGAHGGVTHRAFLAKLTKLTFVKE